MMSKERSRKLLEWGKTVLIVLLLLSALLLGWQTRLFNDFLVSIPMFKDTQAADSQGAAGSGTGGTVAKEAARPSCIVITDDSGGHYGVRYDTGLRDTIYDRTSGILGEALGSASERELVSEEQWRLALSAPGIYFEYMTPVSFPVLDGWLGARMPSPDPDVTLRRVCVTFGEDTNRLYFQNAKDGLFYAAGTASSGGKAAGLGNYSDNGVKFAFETESDAAENAPYMLLMPESIHPVVNVSNPMSQQETLDVVLSVFGKNSQIKSDYIDADGTLVYVGTEFTIRVGLGGQTAFKRTDGVIDTTGVYVSDSEIIERARSIVSDTLGKNQGGAEIFFEELHSDEKEFRSVTFGYYISGGRVYLHKNGYAAKITFTGGIIAEMELNFRRFEGTEEYAELLGERLALAAADGEFMLCYSDTGADRLTPFWAKYELEG